jgi:hypothetical protein
MVALGRPYCVTAMAGRGRGASTDLIMPVGSDYVVARGERLPPG